MICKFLNNCKTAIRKIKYNIFKGEIKFPDVEQDSLSPLPILVYQMGKVASKTIYESIKQVPGLDVFHVHRIGLDVHPNLYNRVAVSREPATIITLVREPIGRSISAFFQHIGSYAKGINVEISDVDILKQSYLNMDEREFLTSVNWFDDEFLNVLRVDVFKYDFGKDAGYAQIRTDRYNILILRSDLEDSFKAKYVGEFLDVEGFDLVQSNITSKMKKGVTYKRFLDNVSLPTAFVDKMLKSKYTKHFFSDDEIAQLQHRWCKDQ